MTRTAPPLHSIRLSVALSTPHLLLAKCRLACSMTTTLTRRGAGMYWYGRSNRMVNPDFLVI